MSWIFLWESMEYKGERGGGERGRKERGKKEKEGGIVAEGGLLGGSKKSSMPDVTIS